jgi:hypothetical protein
MNKKTPCSDKNITRLSSARVQSAKTLRTALQNTQTPDGVSYFDYFKDLDWVNECIFSYPNSDWIGIYLKDENGNIYWTRDSSGTIKNTKLYFQIGIDSDGDPEIINYTTKVPNELLDKESCVIINGKCKEYTNTNNNKKKIIEILPTEVVSQNPVVPPKKNKQVKEKKQITREEFEKMGSKEAIINWMIENMDPIDIMSCLQQDNNNNNNNNKNIVSDASSSLSSKEVNEIFKEISFEDLINQVNEINDLENKYNRIIQICTDSGVVSDDDDIVLLKSKKGLKLVLNESVLDDKKINDLLRDCAKKEALRLTKIAGKKPIS